MATLKISDLSVGDWVQNNYGDYVKVAGTWQGRNFNYQVDILRDGMIGTIAPCNIHPIPITPVILEANGIHKTYECDEYAVYKGEGFSITEYYTDLWEFESRRNRVTIKRVHQLQHALRLAGVEKEIVMPNK